MESQDSRGRDHRRHQNGSGSGIAWAADGGIFVSYCMLSCSLGSHARREGVSSLLGCCERIVPISDTENTLLSAPAHALSLRKLNVYTEANP